MPNPDGTIPPLQVDLVEGSWPSTAKVRVEGEPGDFSLVVLDSDGQILEAFDHLTLDAPCALCGTTIPRDVDGHLVMLDDEPRLVCPPCAASHAARCRP